MPAPENHWPALDVGKSRLFTEPRTGCQGEIPSAFKFHSQGVPESPRDDRLPPQKGPNPKNLPLPGRRTKMLKKHH